VSLVNTKWHVVVDRTSSESGNEGGHAHFDVELHHVSHWMELDVDNLVGQRHKADKHYLIQM
jgi:hypothetical protein